MLTMHHPPQGALDAHHAQLLRAVEEFALELHVLQHSGDVRPVVLCHGPADSQVVAVPWKTPPGQLFRLKSIWLRATPSSAQDWFCSPEAELQP